MAESAVHSTNRAEIWDDKFFGEYVRENEFSPYMGTDMNSIIQVKEDLTKKQGEAITIPFVTKLAGGVKGNTVLEGNEALINNYGYRIPVNIIRNATIVTEAEEQVAEFDIREAGREYLKHWAMEKLRGGSETDTSVFLDAGLSEFGIIDQMHAFATSDTSAVSQYADAAETTVKDVWSSNNSDRVLFGSVESNFSGDHSVDLAKIDASADKLTAASLSLAKQMAKRASPKIRPVKTKEGEWFVYFASPLAFSWLKADSTFATATREGWSRGVPTMNNSEGNPLLRGGDLVYDGIIVREVPEIPYISNVGDSSSDVATGFLCGAQALGVVWAKRTKSTVNATKGTDYEFRYGAGIREMRGVRTLYANSKVWGMVRHYSYGKA